MTKKLALQKVLDQGCAIDCDKGLITTQAVFMNSLGHQFFPGSTLTGNKNRTVGGSDLSDSGIDPLHRFALTNKDLKTVQTRPNHRMSPLHLHGFLFQCFFDHLDHLIRCKRFGNIIKSPIFHSLHRSINGGIPGNDNDRYLRLQDFNGL